MEKSGYIVDAPWRVNVSESVQEGENTIEVEVATLWVNRLIGDESKPYPEWALGNELRRADVTPILRAVIIPLPLRLNRPD